MGLSEWIGCFVFAWCHHHIISNQNFSQNLTYLDHSTWLIIHYAITNPLLARRQHVIAFITCLNSKYELSYHFPHWFDIHTWLLIFQFFRILTAELSLGYLWFESCLCNSVQIQICKPLQLHWVEYALLSRIQIMSWLRAF